MKNWKDHLDTIHEICIEKDCEVDNDSCGNLRIWNLDSTIRIELPEEEEFTDRGIVYDVDPDNGYQETLRGEISLDEVLELLRTL